MKDEFEKFCERYISTAEDEWEKTDNPVDLSAATVAKIMLNKYRELRASAVEVEPLACLADRKGVNVFIGKYYKNGWWTGEICELAVPDNTVHDGCPMLKVLNELPLLDTYAECEAKARAYLEGLDDVNGGK